MSGPTAYSQSNQCWVVSGLPRVKGGFCQLGLISIAAHDEFHVQLADQR